MAVFSGNGSNTAPSFTFSSDTNTGFYRVGADEISIVTNGTDRLRVEGTYGNVGIGVAPDTSQQTPFRLERNYNGLVDLIVRNTSNTANGAARFVAGGAGPAVSLEAWAFNSTGTGARSPSACVVNGSGVHGLVLSAESSGSNLYFFRDGLSNETARLRSGGYLGFSTAKGEALCVGTTSNDGSLLNNDQVIAGSFKTYHVRTPVLTAGTGTYDITFSNNIYKNGTWLVSSHATVNTAFHSIYVIRTNAADPQALYIYLIGGVGAGLSTPSAGVLRLTNAGSSPDQAYDMIFTRIS